MVLQCLLGIGFCARLLPYHCQWVIFALCAAFPICPSQVNHHPHVAMAPGTGNCGVGLCQQLLGVFGLLSGCSPAVCVCLGSLREDPEHTVVFYLISLVHSPGAGCWLETSPHRLSESASHH